MIKTLSVRYVFLLIAVSFLKLNFKNIIIPKSKKKEKIIAKSTKEILSQKNINSRQPLENKPDLKKKNQKTSKAIKGRYLSPLSNTNLFERVCCLDFRTSHSYHAYTFLPYMTTYIFYKLSKSGYKVTSEEKHNWLTKEIAVKTAGVMFRDLDDFSGLPQNTILPLFVAEYSNSIPMIWAFNSYRDFLDFFSHFKRSLASFGVPPKPENELLLVIEEGVYNQELFSFESERADDSEQFVDDYFSLITDIGRAKELIKIKEKMESKIESVNTASFDVVYKSLKDSMIAKAATFSKKVGMSGGILTLVSVYLLPLIKKCSDILENSPSLSKNNKKPTNSSDEF